MLAVTGGVAHGVRRRQLEPVYSPPVGRTVRSMNTGEGWHKSSYSGNTEQNCIEVAVGRPDAVRVRDSKDRQGPALAVARGSWSVFLSGVRTGRLDLR